MFIARGKEDALVTRNFVPGSDVYGEKRISVEVCLVFSITTLISNYDEIVQGYRTWQYVAVKLCRKKIARFETFLRDLVQQNFRMIQN